MSNRKNKVKLIDLYIFKLYNIRKQVSNFKTKNMTVAIKGNKNKIKVDEIETILRELDI